MLFLLYPTLNNAIFKIFTCRQFAEGEVSSYNVYDYSIDCNSRDYAAIHVVAFVMLFVYSIGIPAFFLLVLYLNRRELQLDGPVRGGIAFTEFVQLVHSKHIELSSVSRAGILPNVHDQPTHEQLRSLFNDVDRDRLGYITSAQFAAMDAVGFPQANAPVGQDRAMNPVTTTRATMFDFDREDEAWTSFYAQPSRSGERVGGWVGFATRRLRGKTKAELGFLTQAYKPQFYWFEIVEYTKKLLITGVLMQVAQGSASQLFFGTIIAFFYFALVVRCMPYRHGRTNVLRIVAELQLFLTMLCLLMLRLDLHKEWITSNAVSLMLVVVNFVCSPAPFLYDIAGKSWLATRSLAVDYNKMRREAEA
jgi:hypothetical protein